VVDVKQTAGVESYLAFAWSKGGSTDGETITS
jgi:hypothetical protein